MYCTLSTHVLHTVYSCTTHPWLMYYTPSIHVLHTLCSCTTHSLPVNYTLNTLHNFYSSTHFLCTRHSSHALLMLYLCTTHYPRSTHYTLPSFSYYTVHTIYSCTTHSTLSTHYTLDTLYSLHNTHSSHYTLHTLLILDYIIRHLKCVFWYNTLNYIYTYIALNNTMHSFSQNWTEFNRHKTCVM